MNITDLKRQSAFCVTCKIEVMVLPDLACPRCGDQVDPLSLPRVPGSENRPTVLVATVPEPRTAQPAKAQPPADAKVTIPSIDDVVRWHADTKRLFDNLEATEARLVADLRGVRALGELLATLKEPEAPKGFKDMLGMGQLLKTLWNMAPHTVGRGAPCQQEVWEGPDVDLARLPVQHCWPGDVAPLITWGLTITRGPRKARQNLGIYRQQVLSRNQVIVRWLAHRGGALDFADHCAANPGQPYPVAVALGADDELSDDEKDQWDALEWDEEGGEAPDEVSAEAVNQWLFNTDTVDKMLALLMERGHKVAGGDRLGKTIIFARNQQHAEFIQQRFDANYPEYRGEFARTITFKTEYAQSLIDQFSQKDQAPHIAISVDMLDTGIDVPDSLPSLV